MLGGLGRGNLVRTSCCAEECADEARQPTGLVSGSYVSNVSQTSHTACAYNLYTAPATPMQLLQIAESIRLTVCTCGVQERLIAVWSPLVATTSGQGETRTVFRQNAHAVRLV